MADLLDTSRKLLDGTAAIEDHHPVMQWGGFAEIDARTGFVASFANVAALHTDDGLVLVDTSSRFLCRRVHGALREWTDAPAHTVVFTHGHIDHVFGVELYEADNQAHGVPAPTVIAHEAIADRFARYVETAGYNATINRRQFRTPGFEWPTDYRYPDETYRSERVLEVGGERVELHHSRGETDDHTWVWVPGRRVLCTGDLFIWASPNCGNPQKVQRYVIEWARALRAMDALAPEVLLPGHGLPIIGADAVHTALDDTATLLEHLYRETVLLMNEGARLDDIVHTVRAPEALLAKPYLRPVYDEPEFVVRSIWRGLGGWHDGNPAHLKPAPDGVLAAEVAALAGGADVLARRAVEVAAAGDLRLAGHLAEWAVQAAPEDRAAHRARAEVLEQRVAAEHSTMAKGIFGWAAEESRGVAGGDPTDG